VSNLKVENFLTPRSKLQQRSELSQIENFRNINSEVDKKRKIIVPVPQDI
jgi:hypothetical protein